LDRREARISVAVDGRRVFTGSVAPGRFRVSRPLRAAPSGSAVVTIERRPAFRPSALGLPDDRRLGVFIRSVCVQ
jgi:hypothetical protein